MTDKKNAWEMTLDEYLGDGRVGGELQGFFLDAAVDGMNRVTQTYRNADKSSFRSFAQPDATRERRSSRPHQKSKKT